MVPTALVWCRSNWWICEWLHHQDFFWQLSEGLSGSYPADYSHIEWLFQMTHQSQRLQTERRFMLFQYIIYYLHNRSYKIINDKGQHFKFGKTLSWDIYKTWPYLTSSLMIWRREKQRVKHNHCLCETEIYCQLWGRQRHSRKGPKGHEAMMGKGMIFRLERGREEIIQNYLQ